MAENYFKELYAIDLRDQVKQKKRAKLLSVGSSLGKGERTVPGRHLSDTQADDARRTFAQLLHRRQNLLGHNRCHHQRHYPYRGLSLYGS